MDGVIAALPLALWGAVKLAAKLAAIIVPLVTLFEVLRHHPFFRRAGGAVDPLMRGLGLTREAAVPLFTGIFLGIAYGAGIIIRVAREKALPPRQLFLMGLFLATCHAVVEDTLIFVVIGGNFVVIGGNGWIILGVRVVLAVVLTALLARLWRTAGDTRPET